MLEMLLGNIVVAKRSVVLHGWFLSDKTISNKKKSRLLSV